MKIIDSHQHVFWHGRDDAGLIADMDAHGIDQAWLLTWEAHPTEDPRNYHRALNPSHLRPDGTHPGIPLSDCLVARDRYPARFMLGFCPHPLWDNAPERLAAAVGMYDVRVCGEWKFRLPFDDPRCLELYHACAELKVPVVLHLDVPYLWNQDGERVYSPRWYGGTVANLERALAACPHTVFIGHAPGFWREISGDADQAVGNYPRGRVRAGGRLYDLFERYPNLHADLSAGSALRALKRDTAHAKRFLRRFADRLLFARDYYGGDLQTYLEGLDLPGKVLRKIFRDNARKLLRKK